AQRIEHWSIEKLIPFANNPRTHSDSQVAQIAASIREFGFNNPILVDSKAGIIAGHGRVLAARKLQLATVPVVVLDHLSETQRRAYYYCVINKHFDIELFCGQTACARPTRDTLCGIYRGPGQGRRARRPERSSQELLHWTLAARRS